MDRGDARYGHIPEVQTVATHNQSDCSLDVAYREASAYSCKHIFAAVALLTGEPG